MPQILFTRLLNLTSASLQPIGTMLDLISNLLPIRSTVTPGFHVAKTKIVAAKDKIVKPTEISPIPALHLDFYASLSNGTHSNGIHSSGTHTDFRSALQDIFRRCRLLLSILMSLSLASLISVPLWSAADPHASASINTVRSSASTTSNRSPKPSASTTSNRSPKPSASTTSNRPPKSIASTTSNRPPKSIASTTSNRSPKSIANTTSERPPKSSSSSRSSHNEYLGHIDASNKPQSDFIYYRLKKSETFALLSRRYKLQLSRIRSYNRQIRPQSEALIRLPIYRMHKVKPGATLSRIAQQYKLPVQTLQELLTEKRTRRSKSLRPPKVLTLYSGEILHIPVHYASSVWLYSAYIKSQYKRIAELVDITTASNTQRKFSAELGTLVPLALSDSLPFLSAGEDNLSFTVPFQNQNIALSHVKSYELSKENFHPGIYYHVKRKQTVKASERGTVVFIGSLRGLGLSLVVRHSERFFSFYSGLKTVSATLKAQVNKNDPIGTTHQGMFFSLHYKGYPVDPFEFFEKL